MSLSLFHEVSAEAIETLLDMKNQPLFIEKIRNKFRDFQLHSTHAKSEVLAVGLTSAWSGMLGGGKDPQDVFINLDGAIEMAIQSKKSKAVAVVKWLSKKGVVENTGGASTSYWRMWASCYIAQR